MGINVNWSGASGDPLILNHLARSVGRGQRKQRLQDQALEVDLRAQALDEQARQFDESLNAREYESAAHRQLQREQLGQQAALSAYRDRTALAQQAAEQQFRSYQDEVDFEQQQDLEHARDEREYAGTVYTDVNEEANKALAEFRKQRAKMSPEGVKELNRLSTQLRNIQGAIGNKVSIEGAQPLYDQWFEDLYRTDPAQYVEEPPTPDDEWQQKTRTGEDGTVYGLDRNGTFRKLKDPPPKPLSPEVIEANTHTLPDGVRIFVNPNDGKPTVIQPGDAQEGPQPILKSTDKIALYKSVKELLLKQWEAEHTEVVEGKTKITKPFSKYLDENMAKEIARFNQAFGDPDEETLVPSELQGQSAEGMDLGGLPGTLGVELDPSLLSAEGAAEEAFTIIGPNPAGRFAKKYADGRVELLPEGYAP